MENKETIINNIRGLLQRHNASSAELNYSTGGYWTLKIEKIEIIDGEIYLISNLNTLYNLKDVSLEFLSKFAEYIFSHEGKIRFL